MLLPILLAASLLSVQQAFVHCVDTGAESATRQTQPLRGPSGVTAVLKVSTADDHSKNSHDCNAEYQLLLQPANAGKPIVVDLITSDAGYDRGLSLRLEGFSQDGKRVFGILSETGKYPSTTLFVYNFGDGQVQLIDLRMQFAHMVAANCSVTFEVIGTTQSGAIALELTSAEKCSPDSRWLLNPARSRPEHLSENVSLLSLYKSKGEAP
jgi:hypothetical protein